MTEVYRPIDVLEKQVELINFWTRSRYKDSFNNPFQFIMNRFDIRDSQHRKVPARLSVFMGQRLNISETIFVRSNIIDRLWEFTDVYETHEHETLQREDLPMDFGFAYLERTIHILDAQGKVNAIRAILWSAEPNGIITVQMSDNRDPLDDINRAQLAEHGPDWYRVLGCDLPPLHIQAYSYGKNNQNLTVDDYDLEDNRPTITPPEERKRNIKEHIEEHVVYQNRFNHFMISLWEFMGEHIPQRLGPDRYMKKRLQRAHSPLSEVSVVQLRPYQQRSEYDPEHEPEFVPWSHRWRVREHKRRWIDKKTGELRETTVSAHVKGPEHLPLIEKDRVYNVKR